MPTTAPSDQRMCAARWRRHGPCGRAGGRDFIFEGAELGVEALPGQTSGANRTTKKFPSRCRVAEAARINAAHGKRRRHGRIHIRVFGRFLWKKASGVIIAAMGRGAVVSSGVRSAADAQLDHVLVTYGGDTKIGFQQSHQRLVAIGAKGAAKAFRV